jgi:hypothetical protein
VCPLNGGVGGGVTVGVEGGEDGDHQGGRQRKKTFAKKGDADRFAATVEADKLWGQYVDHSDRTTVAEYARAWAAAGRTVLRRPGGSPA